MTLICSVIFIFIFICKAKIGVAKQRSKIQEIKVCINPKNINN